MPLLAGVLMRVAVGMQPCTCWPLPPRTRRYKLLTPAPNYAAQHAAVQRRFDLCVRATNCILANPNTNLQMVVTLGQLLQQGQHSGTSRMTYTIEDLQQEAGFMLQQLGVFVKVRCGVRHGLLRTAWRACRAQQRPPQGGVTRRMIVAVYSEATL
jgi:hypothetical protein